MHIIFLITVPMVLSTYALQWESESHHPKKILIDKRSRCGTRRAPLTIKQLVQLLNKLLNSQRRARYPPINIGTWTRTRLSSCANFFHSWAASYNFIGHKHSREFKSRRAAAVDFVDLVADNSRVFIFAMRCV